MLKDGAEGKAGQPYFPASVSPSHHRPQHLYQNYIHPGGLNLEDLPLGRTGQELPKPSPNPNSWDASPHWPQPQSRPLVLTGTQGSVPSPPRARAGGLGLRPREGEAGLFPPCPRPAPTILTEEELRLGWRCLPLAGSRVRAGAAERLHSHSPAESPGGPRVYTGPRGEALGLESTSPAPPPPPPPSCPVLLLPGGTGGPR